MYPMPYARALLPAAWVVLCSCSLTLHSPIISSLSGFLQGFSISGFSLLAEILPFYLGYSPIELWDSLSGYVHPGIACLAFWASDWLGAFWASLSGYSSRHDPC